MTPSIGRTAIAKSLATLGSGALLALVLPATTADAQEVARSDANQGQEFARAAGDKKAKDKRKQKDQDRGKAKGKKKSKEKPRDKKKKGKKAEAACGAGTCG